MAPRKPKATANVEISDALIESDYIVLNALLSGHQYIEEVELSVLLKNDLVETNKNNMQGSKVITRITDKGKVLIMARKNVNTATVETPAAAVVAAPSFAIGSFAAIAGNVAEKAAVKGRGRKAIYPFDALEVGNYFQVPVSEKHPNPAVSIAGTVAAANKRHAVATEQTKVTKRKNKETGEIVEKTVPVLSYTKKFAIKQLVDGSAAVVREM